MNFEKQIADDFTNCLKTFSADFVIQKLEDPTIILDEKHFQEEVVSSFLTHQAIKTLPTPLSFAKLTYEPDGDQPAVDFQQGMSQAPVKTHELPTMLDQLVEAQTIALIMGQYTPNVPLPSPDDIERYLLFSTLMLIGPVRKCDWILFNDHQYFSFHQAAEKKMRDAFSEMTSFIDPTKMNDQGAKS